jgi:hypothetical protein
MYYPSISLEEYKEVMQLKAERAHPNAYMRLAKYMGVPTQRLLRISQRGIKRYDYILRKEGDNATALPPLLQTKATPFVHNSRQEQR